MPMERPARSNEIAAPSLFLLTDDASYINGTILVIDDGWEVTNYPDMSKFKS
ncbi:SDR family oxidoreductase [Oceanobacillus longus]|uniref:SDR family oxidoreductase n=1 Tax=Oceanobacillus longus TaxID=930120 RepID=A0ABV8H187_9BACI